MCHKGFDPQTSIIKEKKKSCATDTLPFFFRAREMKAREEESLIGYGKSPEEEKEKKGN